MARAHAHHAKVPRPKRPKNVVHGAVSHKMPKQAKRGSATRSVGRTKVIQATKVPGA